MLTVFWRFILPLWLCLPGFLVSPALCAAAEPQTLLQPEAPTLPLRPFLDFYVDESMSMDIEEAASPALAQSWQPLALERLPRSEGITWLRFTLAPVEPHTRQGTYLLDMGESVPGVPVLYDPVHNELSNAQEWRENTPAQRNILLLPEQTVRPLTCYIRIDGLPGPWFYPMIRTPQNAAANWSGLSRTGAILTLGVVMLLCLLRWASESGQWRVWTALFVAMSLAQGILGMPPLMVTFSFTALASVLTPGLALMLLPHVGRHLMCTRQTSRAVDFQLALLSLPGAVLALLPLLPGWNWLDHWADIWPVGCLIFLPTVLAAWIMGLPGSRRFLLGCTIPALFVGVALVGIDFGLAPNLLASLPLWGIALSALLIAATRAPDIPAPRKKTKPAAAQPHAEDSIINLDHPLDDPNLRIVDMDSGQTQGLAVSLAMAGADQEKDSDANSESWLEARLRVPLDAMLRDGAAMGHCSLPPAVRKYAENMLGHASQMADIISGNAPQSGKPQHDSGQETTVFSLQALLRDVHDAVASLAENAGVSLSWFLPPQMVNEYKGNSAGLGKVLELLLESAVRASADGQVRLSVRKVPHGGDPGLIMFTITDNGTGIPPKDRSPLALARAWEFTSRNGGYFGVEATPQGVTIILSVLLEQIDEEPTEPARSRPHIIIASPDAAERQRLMAMLENLHCRITQATGNREILETQGADPASLLIAQGKLAMPSSSDMAHRFAELARDAGFAHCVILAITADDSQWGRLKPSGFTHAMLEPEDAGGFAATVRELLGENRKQDAGGDGDMTAVDNNVRDAAADLFDELPSIVSYPETDTGLTTDLDDTITDIENSARLEEIAGDSPPQTASDTESEDTAAAMQQDGRREDHRTDAPETEAGLARESPQPPENNDNVSFSEEFVDWVAEPAPAGRHASQPSPQTPAGNEFDEWIGEPIPFIREPQPQDGKTAEREPATARQDNGRAGLAAKQERNLKDLEQTEQHDASAAIPENSKDDDFLLAGSAEDTGDDPEVSALVVRLDKAMAQATKAFRAGDCAAIASATSVIVQSSRNFGLHWLERMGTCVERAAEAGDLDALAALLPELASAVERNRIALVLKK